MTKQERIKNKVQDLKRLITLSYGNCRSALYRVDEDIIDEVINELKKIFNYNIVKTDSTHFEIQSALFVCYKNN